MNTFLQPTYFLDSNNPQIIDTVQRVSGHLNTPAEKARALFYEVRDGCHYNMYKTSFKVEDYRASAVSAAGEGFCLQKAILLTSLARAAGIPSRLIIAAIRNHKAPEEALHIMGTNLFFPHAYNQFFLQGSWISAAATFDRSICEKVDVPVTEFDGFNDALLPAQDNSGLPYIEYVENFGYFPDVPLEWIMQTMPKFYGSNFKEKWQEHL